MKILSFLYESMWGYLVEALELPDDYPIVKAYRNNVPIPENAIIMCFRDDEQIDQLSRVYDGNKQIVFSSVRGTMQLDFYGEDAYDKARQIATLWNSSYTTDTLTNCVPLNNPRIRDLTFVNEAGQYELRFMLDLSLEYNTKYEKTVNIATDISNIDSELIHV